MEDFRELDDLRSRLNAALTKHDESGCPCLEDPQDETCSALMDALTFEAQRVPALEAGVLYEVSLERIRQDVEWGGEEHDDTHTKYDWAEYIRKHNNRALSSVTGNSPDASYRKQMIRVAALAVAAVQSFDRKKAGS